MFLPRPDFYLLIVWSKEKLPLILRMIVFRLFVSFCLIAVVWHLRILAKAVPGIAADTTVKAAVTWYLGQGQPSRVM